MRQVRIWVYDGVLASGVTAMVDVFATANLVWQERDRGRHGRPAPLFACRVESLQGKPLKSASGQVLPVDGRIDPAAPSDAVIVPGPFVGDIDRFLKTMDRLDDLQPLLAALRRQYRSGAVLAAYCSGSFLLAEAGLLDGRTATTHWGLGTAFRKRYPKVDLRLAEVITEHGRLLCSGAVTTYFNLALRLVEKFAGPAVAARVANLLLIDTRRISQGAYAALTLRDQGAMPSDPVIARALRWMDRRLAEPFQLGALARHLAVSPRSLNRRFHACTGLAPLRQLQVLRVETAKRLLEAGELSVEQIGQRVGYSDLSSFRRLFKRETGLSPRDYQQRFALRHAVRRKRPAKPRNRAGRARAASTGMSVSAR